MLNSYKTSPVLQSYPLGSSKGRSVSDLVRLLDDNDSPKGGVDGSSSSSGSSISSKRSNDDNNCSISGVIHSGNGYIELQNKNIFERDIPAVVALAQDEKYGYNAFGNTTAS